MEQRPSFVTLFFLTGTVLSGIGLPMATRFLRLRGAALSWFTAWLIRTLSDSNVSHCAVAIGGVVYDPSLEGDRLWPLDAFLARFGTITEFFIVPGSSRVPPSDSRRKPWLLSLLSWLSRGEVPADNCVTRCVAVMRKAGHDPRGVVTPSDLRSWCITEGFRHERFDQV